MTIVSDRHSSIENACATVLPWATRGICYYHMQQNIVSKYRARNIMHLVKRAAYAYTLVDFNRHMDAIQAVHPELAAYLLKADPKLWSRVHFPGDRYNIKTSNIAETLNNVLKKAKGFPIAFMLEFIREKLTRWFCKRREDALSLRTTHSRGVKTLLAIRADYARNMIGHRIDTWRFEIRDRKRGYLVDLQRPSCSCGLTDVEKIPCSHIISAATEAGVNYATYVSPIYGKDYLYATYGHCIYPIDGELDAGPFSVRPPEPRRGPGRRRLSRWHSYLELSRKRKKNLPRKMTISYRCSKCKQPGHRKPNCVSIN